MSAAAVGVWSGAGGSGSDTGWEKRRVGVRGSKGRSDRVVLLLLWLAFEKHFSSG